MSSPVDFAIADLNARARELERLGVRFRQGVVTDDDPLSVAVGGDSVAYTDVTQLATAGQLAVDDVVACLAFASQLLVLGRLSAPPAWTPYTPTVTTLGTGGAKTASYQKIGRTVHYRGRIVTGSGGLTGSPVTISLPFTAAANGQVGVMTANNVGTQLHVGAAVIDGGASVLKGQFEGNAFLHASGPFAWGDTDVLTWHVTYEAAS